MANRDLLENFAVTLSHQTLSFINEHDLFFALKEKVTPKSVFFLSSAIKRLY